MDTDQKIDSQPPISIGERIASVAHKIYGKKDINKFSRCNKLIARGEKKSSSEKYRIACGEFANVGIYDKDDIVGISVNGKRTGRIEVDYEELDLAIATEVTFITDIAKDRNRLYNLGERRVCDYLIKANYVEHAMGTWIPQSQYLIMKVVHFKKSKFDVYIGRPSKWGNPFSIGKDGTREEVISKYQDYVINSPELIEALPELKGKILGCWCSPKPCHGDVLSVLANPTISTGHPAIKF